MNIKATGKAGLLAEFFRIQKPNYGKNPLATYDY